MHKAGCHKQSGHPVKKDDLQKCVRFLRALVRVMDDGFTR